MVSYLFSTVFRIVTYGIILAYVMRMKTLCGYCTQIKETNWLFYLTAFLLVEVLIAIFFPLEIRKFLIENPFFLFIIVLINIANIIILYRFINAMMISQCKGCTQDWRRTYLYYYARIVLILYGINIVLMITAFTLLSGLPKNKLAGLIKKSK